MSVAAIVLAALVSGAVGFWALPISRRVCGLEIAATPWITGVIGTVVGALTGWAIGWNPTLPAYTFIAALGVVLVLLDREHLRLPNQLTIPAYLVMGVLLLIPTVTDAQFNDYARAWLAAAVLFLGYFLLALITPRNGIGMGDVKLAGLVGLSLGYLSWSHVIGGVMIATLAAGAVGIYQLARGTATKDTGIAYGPYILGAALGVLIY